ncbi:MAG: asparagine synthase (glutamine-hydrolyzing) [Cyclobacteriaceae bacterium]|nr:asparagine synthase (glutamine-hydrolyzing) [Cyclobacteriaceae bacterium HetDA_MAG_MS6]
MCGITGIYAFNEKGKNHFAYLAEATRALEKRGPDSQGTTTSGRVGLGHQRLSIIDTSERGSQPMSDRTGRYTIIYNGEVYNYRSIKKDLETLGYSFASDTDTEVILYAYIQWGTDFLSRLNGFFGLAIYDAQEQSLLVARDRYGIKPLIYFQDEDKLVFASEMKSLLAYGIPKQIDPMALRLYFQLTYIPASKTIFQHVNKLEPGHFLFVSKGEVENRSFYQLPYHEQPPVEDFQSAKAELKRLLQESVQKRLVSDVPLGSFLSGGIDSSVITAIAAQEVKDFKTFSIGFKDNSYFDETRYAQLVADQYQTDHHVFKLSNNDLLEHVEDIVTYLDEPFADSSAIPVHILSRLTRQEVTVALSGDGADEVFSGYNKHSAWLLSAESNVRNQVVGALKNLWRVLPKSRGNRLWDKTRQLHRFAEILQLDLNNRYWSLATFSEADFLDRLLLETSIVDPIAEGLVSSIESADLNKVLWNDVKMVLSGDMLTKVDMMSMANSLEVRVPFLDHEVVDFAFSLPAHFKARGNSRKIILRESFRDWLPEALYSRPKHGFEVPLNGWFKSELASELDSYVFNRQRIEDQGLFNYITIDQMKKRLYSFDPGDVHIHIWSMYVFQKWWDRYFKG